MEPVNLMKFSAIILKIGINPYVFVPEKILNQLFAEAGKDKGHIPVKLIINNEEFVQHLVRYSGAWRLYLNTPMRKAASKAVGDKIQIVIHYDTVKRDEPVNKKFENALNSNSKAKQKFQSLAPSRQKEIIRYINSLKTEIAEEHNINKAISFLLGKDRFIGRDKP